MIKYNSVEIGSSHCNKMNDCEKIWMKFYKKKDSLILEFRKNSRLENNLALQKYLSIR